MPKHAPLKDGTANTNLKEDEDTGRKTGSLVNRGTICTPEIPTPTVGLSVLYQIKYIRGHAMCFI